MRVKIDTDDWHDVLILSNYCGEDVNIPIDKLEEIKQAFKRFGKIQKYLQALILDQEKMKGLRKY